MASNGADPLRSLLEVENLRVSYGSVVAVRDVSLEVAPHEIVGVIGPNGAGKSTTLKAITGVVRPADGRITFSGRNLVGARPESIARLGVSLVPEGRHAFTRLTVHENLRLAGALLSSRAALVAALSEIYERFPDLDRLQSQPSGRLSGGEQQQLVIGRALIAHPKLLILDEPSLGLAPLLVERVFSLLAELRDEGVTVLLVEQNAARTLELSDRCYAIRNGVSAAIDETNGATSETDLLRLYLGDTESA